MCPNPQETADLVTFTEEILNGKLYFLCRDAKIEGCWISTELLYFPPYTKILKIYEHVSL